jgi:hypothetical protein
MQTTLFQFLKTNKLTNFPLYFYLDYPSLNVYWTTDEPKYIKYKKYFKLKKYNTTCILVSNYAFSNNEPIKEQSARVSILKSNLQKCIRKSQVEQAIKTSIKFMELNFIDFIRRLSIIMVEDCIIHNSFNFILWLCIFGNYSIKTESEEFIKDRCIDIVKYLASLEYRLCVNKKKDKLPNKINFIKISSFPEHIKNVILSLECRSMFGGMNGDILLLRSFMFIVIEKYLEKPWIPEYINKELPIVTTKYNAIRKNEIDLVSVDYHGFPYMIENIWNRGFMDQMLQTDKQKIKAAIWLYSSSLSNKNFIENDASIKKSRNSNKEMYKLVWEEIKYSTRAEQIHLLNKLYMD